MKVALAGDVALELMAPYFREAGFDVYVSPGFGTWQRELLDPDSGLHAFAPDAVCDVTAYDAKLSAEIPGFYDERMRTLASMPYSLAGIRAIVDEFSFSTLAAPKKVLAVDADQTLWRGILSEDGIGSLVPYVDFQRGLLALREAGVVLVLLTKNDFASPFVRGGMPLVDGDFAVRKINWRPKAGNLLEACAELRLSPDSVVFVDDNPHERAQMSAHLPSVTVPPFPSDLTRPAQFLRRLREYFFADMGRTAEDRLRLDDYARRLAHPPPGDASALDGYLRGLDLRVDASAATEDDLDRLAQMAGKTNQFNATTIRRSRDEFAELLADPSRKVFVFRAFDRFGEQGLVCYAVVDLKSHHLTDFVMSCRAMGRTLEHFVWRYLADRFGELVVDFVPTAKNAAFSAFLQSGMRDRTYYVERDSRSQSR